jgi:hypothetical protein
MTDPVLATVATTLAARAAEAAADGVHTAWTALVRLVRGRLAADRAGAAALTAAEADPADSQRVTTLALALERAAAADPDFGSQLRDLWSRASAELSASESGVVNSSTGTVGGHLIQARDLHVEGGLSLGDVYRRQPP